MTVIGIERAATIETLVTRAIDGDQRAWETIVERFHRVVWKAVNMTTTDEQLRQDAFAATWLRVAANLHRIRDPQRLAGWLTKTAINEVRAQGRKQGRYVLSGDGASDAGVGGDRRPVWEGVDDRPVDDDIVRTQLATQVRQAFARLDETCRELLTLLILTDPTPSYADVAMQLGRPHGWLGPTRLRCLDKMRATPELVALSSEGQR